MNINSMAYRRSQAGSTLVAVLLILLVITIIGVIAMKQGLTSLNISTNSQVQTVLAQSSDAALNQFTKTDLSAITTLTGVIGAVINDRDPTHEYVFCYRPTSTDPFGMTVNTNIIAGNGDTNSTVTGVNVDAANYCNLTTAGDFGSSRKAAITQVAVTVPGDTTTLPPLSGLPTEGTDVSSGSALPKSFITQQRFRVTATSMLPAFSTSSLSTVQSTCLQGRVSDNTRPELANANSGLGVESLTDCLSRLGVPANTQVQEFNLNTSLNVTTP